MIFEIPVRSAPAAGEIISRAEANTALLWTETPRTLVLAKAEFEMLELHKVCGDKVLVRSWSFRERKNTTSSPGQQCFPTDACFTPGASHMAALNKSSLVTQRTRRFSLLTSAKHDV